MSRLRCRIALASSRGIRREDADGIDTPPRLHHHVRGVLRVVVGGVGVREVRQGARIDQCVVLWTRRLGLGRRVLVGGVGLGADPGVCLLPTPFHTETYGMLCCVFS